MWIVTFVFKDNHKTKCPLSSRVVEKILTQQTSDLLSHSFVKKTFLWITAEPRRGSGELNLYRWQNILLPVSEFVLPLAGGVVSGPDGAVPLRFSSCLLVSDLESSAGAGTCRFLHALSSYAVLRSVLRSASTISVCVCGGGEVKPIVTQTADRMKWPAFGRLCTHLLFSGTAVNVKMSGRGWVAMELILGLCHIWNFFF